MNYTVRWLPDADRVLLAQLLRAADKQQILRAAHTVENLLRGDPWTVGEGRDGERRIVFERPLLLLFRIDDDDHTVFIELVK